MSPGTYGLVLVFLAAGTIFGWFANRAVAAHADVKSQKKKLPGFRKTRMHNGFVAIAIAFALVIIVFDILGSMIHK